MLLSSASGSCSWSHTLNVVISAGSCYLSLSLLSVVQVCGVNGEEEEVEVAEEGSALGEEIGSGDEVIGEADSERASPDGRVDVRLLANIMDDVGIELPQPEWLKSLQCASPVGQACRFRLKIGRLEDVSNMKTELFIQIG